MSTKVESQAILNTTMREAGTIMKQVVAPDLSGFKAPFSERRILLISGDSGLVMMATLLALAGWAWVQSIPLNAALMTSYWHWFPINLAVW